MRKQWKRYAISTMVIPGLLLAGCSSNGDGEKGASSSASSSAVSSGSAAVNEEGYPLTAQPITLKMFTRIAPVNGPFKDMPVFQDYDLDKLPKAAQGFAQPLKFVIEIQCAALRGHGGKPVAAMIGRPDPHPYPAFANVEH